MSPTVAPPPPPPPSFSPGNHASNSDQKITSTSEYGEPQPAKGPPDATDWWSLIGSHDLGYNGCWLSFVSDRCRAGILSVGSLPGRNRVACCSKTQLDRTDRSSDGLCVCAGCRTPDTVPNNTRRLVCVCISQRAVLQASITEGHALISNICSSALPRAAPSAELPPCVALKTTLLREA